MVLRRITHTSTNFKSDSIFARISLSSNVPRDRVAAYSLHKDSIREVYETQPLSFYHKIDPKAPSRKTSIEVNEMNNFLLRHYCDELILSLHKRVDKEEAAAGLGMEGSVKCLFRTKIELNNLELNTEKQSIMIVGTTPMRNK